MIERRTKLVCVAVIALMAICIVLSCGCLEDSWLTDNVKIEEVSAYAPAKDHVIVSVEVVNNNDFEGLVMLGSEVNCGTVTWNEKKEPLILLPNSKSTVKIDFQGAADRIPTLCKEYEYQARIYGHDGRIIDESDKKIGKKPHGLPD